MSVWKLTRPIPTWALLLTTSKGVELENKLVPSYLDSIFYQAFGTPSHNSGNSKNNSLINETSQEIEVHNWSWKFWEMQFGMFSTPFKLLVTPLLEFRQLTSSMETQWFIYIEETSSLGNEKISWLKLRELVKEK